MNNICLVTTHWPNNKELRQEKFVHFCNSVKETAYEYFKLQHLIKKVKGFDPKQDQSKYNDVMEQ